MAIVRFKGFGEVEVPVGTSLLEAATQAHFPEGSACGGVCACSTCHVYVTPGRRPSQRAEDDEADILDKAFDVRAGSRLGLPVEDRARRRDRGGDHARERRGLRERAPGRAREVHQARELSPRRGGDRALPGARATRWDLEQGGPPFPLRCESVHASIPRQPMRQSHDSCRLAVRLVVARTHRPPRRTSQPGFLVDRFNPSERGSEWFALDTLDLRGALRPALGIVARVRRPSLRPQERRRVERNRGGVGAAHPAPRRLAGGARPLPLRPRRSRRGGERQAPRGPAAGATPSSPHQGGAGRRARRRRSAPGGDLRIALHAGRRRTVLRALGLGRPVHGRQPGARHRSVSPPPAKRGPSSGRPASATTCAPPGC